MGLKGLDQGPSGEITLPNLGFDPTTFRTHPLGHTPYDLTALLLLFLVKSFLISTISSSWKTGQLFNYFVPAPNLTWAGYFLPLTREQWQRLVCNLWASPESGAVFLTHSNTVVRLPLMYSSYSDWASNEGLLLLCQHMILYRNQLLSQPLYSRHFHSVYVGRSQTADVFIIQWFSYQSLRTPASPRFCSLSIPWELKHRLPGGPWGLPWEALVQNTFATSPSFSASLSLSPDCFIPVMNNRRITCLRGGTWPLILFSP